MALEWSRVDLWRRRITFKEGMDKKNGKAGLIPLNRQVTRALVSRARFRARYCPESPWVCCRRNGTRIVSKKRLQGLGGGSGRQQLSPARSEKDIRQLVGAARRRD